MKAAGLRPQPGRRPDGLDQPRRSVGALRLSRDLVGCSTNLGAEAAWRDARERSPVRVLPVQAARHSPSLCRARESGARRSRWVGLTASCSDSPGGLAG